jgi:hypothetical protein
MNSNFDTQKIRIELSQELRGAKQAFSKERNVAIAVELGYKIDWLKSKLQFLASPEYQERKMQS